MDARADILLQQHRSRMEYDLDPGGRDLRIDFVRGVVMMVVIVIHIDIFSLFNFVLWERIGFVSGAEGFVILSGIILGVVHRKTIDKRGARYSSKKLLLRAGQLYLINLAVIATVAALDHVSFIDARVLTTFTDQTTGVVHPLFPGPAAPLSLKVLQALRLQIGPHQFQIMGLYVCLLICTPLILWSFRKGYTLLVLIVSLGLYVYSQHYPSRPTGAQFEYAFPLLAWQILYVYSMAYGYFREEMSAAVQGHWRRALYAVSLVIFLACFVLAQCTPNPGLPDWLKISLVPPETFQLVYEGYFSKNKLGALRLVNYFVVLLFGFSVLTRFWYPIYRAIGWFFVPLGQASLYSFIVHIFFVLLVFNIPYFSNLKPSYGSGSILLTTSAHVVCLLAIWLMIRAKLLFGIIPR